MNIVIYDFIYVVLFFILTPNILFCLSKNKYIAALFHGILFSFTIYIIKLDSFDSFEPMDDIFLDPSCNTILKEDSTETEGSGLYFIDGSNCIGPQTLE